MEATWRRRLGLGSAAAAVATLAGVALLCAVLVSGATGAAAGAGRPVVVIDPGHDEKANLETSSRSARVERAKIKDGGGATGIVTGLREPVFNLGSRCGCARCSSVPASSVVMTRTSTAGVSMGNIARARIANRAGADLFLRIHADGSTDRSVSGTHTLVPGAVAQAGRTTSTAAAGAQAGSSSAALSRGSARATAASRSAPTSRGSTGPNVPAILVEVGYLSNPDEDRLLATASVPAQRLHGASARERCGYLGLPVRCA